jgi:RNA polymerase sigma factor (sigma-70 family)
MPDVSDMDLLRDYQRQGSEEAFAELVRRHVNLVYSAALRHAGIAAHAEEITQAVFVILARKAAGLRPDTILDAWLYETTRLTALSFLRGERRRQWREQEAYMQSTFRESTGDLVWHQLSPLLDEAMARLGKKDREAVVLRFFKDKSLREVAAALQVTEAAAQSRVHRALEKLHRYFARRGVSSTTAIIAGAISAHSVQAAPVALAKAVTAVALAKGATASTSTLALIKGALKIMACTKMKATIVAGVVAILVAGTTPIVIHHFREFSWTHELSNDEVSQYSNRTGTTPEQVTKTFFDACGHEDWTEVSTFWEAGGYPLDDRFKSHYGGLQIINLGRPFWARFRSGERYPGVLVPYEIRLQDGTISKGRLAIRCDNPDNRWYFDGGM